MTTPCNLPYQAVGPFAQTLYLGCSVIDYSMNLGWGGETSSCTVNLAADYSAHPQSSVFAPNNTYLNTLNQRDGTRQDPQSLAFTGNVDNTKSLQRTISEKEIKKWNDIVYRDITTQADPNLKDTGKKCWPTYITDPTALNWQSYDPGFIGNKNHYLGNADNDIIGCPTFFRFADTWFGGMIKNWKYNNGKYTVEINSFASLLKGCMLILQKYHGSISTIIPGTSDALKTGPNVAVPYGDIDIPTNEEYDLYNPDSYKGSIYQGNIPNIFNIFGWLESSGFGNSGYIPDRGVSAGLVYDALVALLSSSLRNENQFNPYGAIVAKTPLERSTGVLLDPHNTFYFQNAATDGGPQPQSPVARLSEMGLIRCPIAVDGLPRSLLSLDLSAVPRPPDGVYINNDTMDLVSFIDFCCQNGGVDFFIDFEPSVLASNYSGAIRIRTVSRRVQPLPNTIKDFILNLNAGNNIVEYNFGEEYNDTKTRSVLIGGPQQRLHQFTNHTYSTFRHAKVFEPMLGSFIDTSSAMNIANQTAGSSRNTYRMPDHRNQRPLDNINWKADSTGSLTAQTNSAFTFVQPSPYGAMTINRGSYLNTSKPILNNDLLATPAINSYPLYKDLISPYFGKSNNKEIRKVYFDNKTRQMQLVIDFRDIQALFPTSYDINDGTWGSAGQTIKSYYPGQIDYSPWNILGTPTGGDVGYGKFVVTESELRAAIGNSSVDGAEPFLTWWNYTVSRSAYNYPTALARIIYDYWARAFYPPFAAAVFKLNIPYQKQADYYSFVSAMSSMGVVFPIRRLDLDAQHYYNAHSACQTLLRNIHAFLKNLGDTHYGRSYAVRLPSINGYVDSSGKRRYNYEICDSAWEEVGNTIDDTMQVGSAVATALADEQGKFGPMLGFDNTAEYYQPFVILNPQLNRFGAPLSALQRAYVAIQGGLDASTGKNNWYLPLVHDLPEDSFAMLPYASYQTALPPGMGTIAYSSFPTSTSAHGFTPNNDQKFKLYTKVSIANENPDDMQNPNIVFLDGAPRAILQTPSPIKIQQHLNLVDLEEVFMWGLFGDQGPSEVGGIFSTLGGSLGAATIYGGRAMMDIYLSLCYSAGAGVSALSPSVYSNRAALPVFAAIPIKNNLMCYGPWVSHPGIIKNIVFPGLQANNLDIALTNNLAGGIDVQIDESLVPWEYGGILALDAAALKKVAENNNFQQVLEYGSLTLAGIQLNNARLGDKLLSGDYAPIVTNLNVSIGSNGITTRYELRTFSRKLGFYNKEQADNIQKLNREFIKNYQSAYQNSKNVLNRALMYSKPTSLKYNYRVR